MVSIFFHAVEYAYNHYSKLYLINCLPPFHLVLLLENSRVLSFEVCSFAFPFWLLLWISPASPHPPTSVKLILDIASCCNQQPSLSTTGWNRVIPVGGAIASPYVDATWRGVLCLSKVTPTVWGMTQHRYPGGCSFISFPEQPTPDSP